jgi:hypothetical protein
MNDPLEYAAAYISPLTDKEHARIGRIAILWGQIEYCVDELLEHVTGFNRAELETLGVADRPVAAKVDFLNRVKDRHPDQDYRTKIADFCAIIHETKTSRNHVFHGMWGWRANERTKQMIPAARKPSALRQPFKYTQLPALEKKLCKCSRMGLDLCAPVWGSSVRARFTRFIHHDDIDDPKWMTQWSERNRLDGEHLDHSAREGELPRLRALFPLK